MTLLVSLMTYAIQVDDLYKTYANQTQALRGVSLDIAQGDFFSLLGPNGAGKSTLIGIMTSIVNKTQGDIRVMGVSLEAEPAKAKKYLGVVPQEINLNVFETCQQVMLNQAAYYGVPRAVAKPRSLALLDQLQLLDKKDQTVKTLSGGMKRRLMIARALVHDPDILVLDEPTAGVDVEIRQSMWAFIKELNEQQGKTIILTTHYLEEAEQLSRHIAIIDHGVVIENTNMKQLLTQLDSEFFTLSLSEAVTTLPELDGFAARLTAPDEISVEIKRDQALGPLITHLTQAGLCINRVHPQSNRLEQFFLSRINRNR